MGWKAMTTLLNQRCLKHRTMSFCWHALSVMAAMARNAIHYGDTKGSRRTRLLAPSVDLSIAWSLEKIPLGTILDERESHCHRRLVLIFRRLKICQMITHIDKIAIHRPQREAGDYNGTENHGMMLIFCLLLVVY